MDDDVVLVKEEEAGEWTTQDEWISQRRQRRESYVSWLAQVKEAQTQRCTETEIATAIRNALNLPEAVQGRREPSWNRDKGPPRPDEWLLARLPPADMGMVASDRLMEPAVFHVRFAKTLPSLEAFEEDAHYVQGYTKEDEGTLTVQGKRCFAAPKVKNLHFATAAGWPASDAYQMGRLRETWISEGTTWQRFAQHGEPSQVDFVPAPRFRYLIANWREATVPLRHAAHRELFGNNWAFEETAVYDIYVTYDRVTVSQRSWNGLIKTTQPDTAPAMEGSPGPCTLFE